MALLIQIPIYESEECACISTRPICIYSIPIFWESEKFIIQKQRQKFNHLLRMVMIRWVLIVIINFFNLLSTIDIKIEWINSNTCSTTAFTFWITKLSLHICQCRPNLVLLKYKRFYEVIIAAFPLIFIFHFHYANALGWATLCLQITIINPSPHHHRMTRSF